MLLQKGFMLVSEAADLYATTKIEFLEFLLTKVGVRSGVLTGLGITASRAASVNKRFSKLVSETAPRIRERITARLASRRSVSISDISGNSIRAAMRRATKSHGLLKNTLLAAAAQARCVSSQMPDLRATPLVSCARGGRNLQDWLRGKLRDADRRGLTFL